jgi:release factor glutamine methyltransferase
MLYEEIRPKLQICKSVYRPQEDSRMLGHSIEKYAFGNMLDMGTATGIQGIIGSLKGCKVTFADVTKEAVECARGNAKINNVKGTFIRSDVFSNIKGKFNTITFDPPYLRSIPLGTGKTNVMIDGGTDGREITDRFLEGYKKHVLKKYTVLLVESYWNNFQNDVRDLNAEMVEKRHYPLLGDFVVLKFGSV